jgi:hypothetical protein
MERFPEQSRMDVAAETLDLRRELENLGIDYEELLQKTRKKNLPAVEMEVLLSYLTFIHTFRSLNETVGGLRDYQPNTQIAANWKSTCESRLRDEKLNLSRLNQFLASTAGSIMPAEHKALYNKINNLFETAIQRSHDISIKELGSLQLRLKRATENIELPMRASDINTLEDIEIELQG